MDHLPKVGDPLSQPRFREPGYVGAPGTWNPSRTQGSQGPTRTLDPLLPRTWTHSTVTPPAWPWEGFQVPGAPTYPGSRKRG